MKITIQNTKANIYTDVPSADGICLRIEMDYLTTVRVAEQSKVGVNRMSDLIDRKEAVEAVKNEMLSWLGGDSHDYRDVVDAIMDLPTVDALPVIRCRDCRWYLPNMMNSPFDTDGFDRWGGLANCQNEMGVAECNEEDYCSFGERRES